MSIVAVGRKSAIPVNKYGALTALERLGRKQVGIRKEDGKPCCEPVWKCLCNLCGGEYINTAPLVRRVRSCGCDKTRPNKRNDVSGKVFGSLAVGTETKINNSGDVSWLCQCSLCGVEKYIKSTKLMTGRAVDCGCSGRERANQHLADWVRNNEQECFLQARKSFHSRVESLGYTLLSEYINARKPVRMVCDHGHEMEKTPACFMVSGCGFCRDIKMYRPDRLSRRSPWIESAVTREARSSKVFSRSEIRSFLLPVLAESSLKALRRGEGMTLDHIIPFSWFDHDNQEQIKMCWSPENLRYLPKVENRIRGNRMREQDLDFINQSSILLDILDSIGRR